MNRCGRLALIAVTWAAAVGIAAGSSNAQSTTSPGEKFILTGVVYIDGGRGLAWLQEPTFTNNQVVIVRLGDSVGPYRLTKVSDDQVELEGPGGKVSVPLAGGAGAISVASVPGARDSSTVELAPQPALEKPTVMVVPRGDARREFPEALLLPGAGAQPVGGVGSSAGPQPVSQSSAVSPALDRGVVPASMQTLPPELPPHPALNSPNAMVIPRGDPRREFPASSLLIGAGARVLGERAN